MPTRVYGEFAEIYARHWEQFGRLLLPWFPVLVKRFDLVDRSILDLACGTGHFTIGVAGDDRRVIGVDQSPDMLRIARERARTAGTDVQWIEQDMRRLRIDEPVELVTCWFDSLNYLVEPQDVRDTFRAVRDALVPGGAFLFDVNTISGLSEQWNTCTSIQVDEPNCFVVTDAQFDEETSTNTLELHGFVKDHHGFKRVHERHIQRGYPIGHLVKWLKDAGFDHVEPFTRKNLGEATEKDFRAFFCARRSP